MQERDLYPPLKSYLEHQGYEVKSEILNCDVVAVRGDEPVLLIELKLQLNLTVLLQAVDRLKHTDHVYIGVPRGIAALKKRRKPIIKLIRMLGLGLIVVDPDTRIGNVDVLCDPGAFKPRQIKKYQTRLLKEFQERVGDPNSGGSSMQAGIMTAYRQKAIAIAGYLLENGATKASVIAVSIGEPKTRNILYDNVYGWFDRIGKGIYSLSPRGLREIPGWQEKSKLV